MAKSEPIDLLGKLTEHSDFYTAIFFTYSADLAFFEEAILYPLWQNGCRNNLVFMDARRYADTIGDLRGSVTWVGRRYILIPVDLGPMKSFHPKLVLLLGHERGRLLVGSGNLTFTGVGHNYEVFTCLDWTPKEPGLQHLFAQTWNLVNTVLERWGYSDEARTMLNKAVYVSDWLTSPVEPVAGIQLFHTLDEPLIEQIDRALKGEDIERITILSPFLDDAATTLSELYDRFRPSDMHLIFQDQRTVGNAHALQGLFRAGVPLKAFRFNDDERYLHAKVYIFETAEASYALTGSANCTRAAWLLNSAHGNLEVMLLRRANLRQHFASLLRGLAGRWPVTSLDDIEFKRQELPEGEGEEAGVRLLDVSVTGDQLSVSFRISSLYDGVADLRLRVSTTPPYFIRIGRYDVGCHTPRESVPSELRASLTHPLSASVWGMTSDGRPVDLHCNELWITDVDVMRREIGRALTAADACTGRYLAEMILSSEEEWRDLYEALVRLIELDVAGLKRRGGTYTASPPSKRQQPQGGTGDQEIEILLVSKADEAIEQAEIAVALFRESPFYAWFEYVRGRLPGAGSTSLDRDNDKEDRPASLRALKDKQRRRRWTPPERVGRCFVSLVNKYIRSLNNIEYMQTASLYHVLTYYAVFQRIVWLLLQHNVINTESFVQLATDINRGFFGVPADEPPVLCPRLRQHMRRIWRDEWLKAEVPFYALASGVLSENLVNNLGVEEMKTHIHEQNLRVLCGIVSVMGISWVNGDTETLAQVAGAYGQDTDVFALRVRGSVYTNLPYIATVLDNWSRKATMALAENDDVSFSKLICRARVDYDLARYDILALLQDAEEQIRLCSDLIFWMGRAGDPDGAREWSNTLVNLLQARGESSKVAKALFEEGRRFFFDRDYEESANKLRQSLVLAERLGDKALSEKCKQYLEYTEFLRR